MAKRKMKRRSRKTQPVRLLNIAQGVLVGNVVTEAMFQTNLMEFVSGRIDGSFLPGSDGSFRVTLPELIGFGDNKIGGMSADKTLGGVIRSNLERPGVTGAMIATLILAKPAFKLGKRTLGGVIRPINRQLKGTGVAL